MWIVQYTLSSGRKQSLMLFRPWLGTNSLGKEYSNYESKRDGFNRIVKHALSSGQGMMFVINLGTKNI
jgi:hypothetical protein